MVSHHRWSGAVQIALLFFDVEGSERLAQLRSQVVEPAGVLWIAHDGNVAV